MVRFSIRGGWIVSLGFSTKRARREQTQHARIGLKGLFFLVVVDDFEVRINHVGFLFAGPAFPSPGGVLSALDAPAPGWAPAACAFCVSAYSSPPIVLSFSRDAFIFAASLLSRSFFASARAASTLDFVAAGSLSPDSRRVFSSWYIVVSSWFRVSTASLPLPVLLGVKFRFLGHLLDLVLREAR